MENQLVRAAIVGVLGAMSAGCGGAEAERVDANRAPIIDGRPATAGELFGTVAITDPMTGEPSCTGTLIAPSVVVTAAHCVVEQDAMTGAITREFTADELDITAGELTPVNATADNIWPVVQIVRHPGYPGDGNPKDSEGLGQEDDIAMLILDGQVDAVGVVPIPAPGSAGAMLTAGQTLTISGYGNRDEAGNAFGDLYIAETPFVRSNGNELLAGGTGNPDTCQGDSGGPIYAVNGSDVLLVGSTARGREDAQATCGEGGIYTFAPAYAQWLADNSNGQYDGPSNSGAGAAGGAGGAGGSGGGNAGNGGTAGSGGSGPPPSSGGESDDDGGCSVRGTSRGGSPGWIGLVLALGVFLRRRS